MPVLANAKKALRSSKRKALMNSQVKAQMRSMLKKVQAQPTLENMRSAFSSIDRATKKNIIHRSKAARYKSRVSKLMA